MLYQYFINSLKKTSGFPACMFFLLLFPAAAFAQSDACSGAGALAVNTSCVTTAFSMPSATFGNTPADAPLVPCNSKTSYKDGWYTFITNSTTTSITINGTSNKELALAVYSGSCGSFIQVACNAPGTANASLIAAVSPSTTYYLRVMRTSSSGGDMSGTICIAINCVAPSQATGFTLATVTSTSVPANFSGTANGYLVVSSLTSTQPSQPVNGTIYTAANISTLGAAFTFIQNSSSTTITSSGLTANTRYYYFIYAYNDSACLGGPAYNTSGPLTGNGTTCTTTPTGVTNSGVTQTAFNLSWTSTIGGGSSAITYTLQVSTSAAFSTNITGSPFSIADPTTTYNITGLNPNTNYFYRILANNGCSSSYVSGSIYTGFCSSTSSTSSSYISNFSTTTALSNINNTSGYSSSGYGNFIAQSVAQQASGTVNFSATFVGGALGFNIWVDWNGDLDFNDAGENVYASGSYNASNTGTFTVPSTAVTGNYRMRIVANLNSTNPLACGSITAGETEDYNFSVVTPTCTSNPANSTATAITTTSATINWTAAPSPPSNGYQYYISSSSTTPLSSATPSGSTAAGVITANLSTLSPGTIYYVWTRSNCGSFNGQGIWIGPLSFTTPFGPTTICQGTSGTISAVPCSGTSSLGNTISGTWNAATNPTALRPLALLSNSATCSFDSFTANYTSVNFTVSTTGTYTFAMNPDPAFNGMGYIVQGTFTPGVCGSGNWIIGDDDSGASSQECQMTSTLTAGVTYTLISTIFSASNITYSGSYQWNVTGPSDAIQWYTAATGGTLIATASPFNPVGVAGSGLANTNTPGTITFYSACAGSPSVRTPIDFIVNGPTGAISGSGTICGGSTTISIALTGTAPWTFTYTDGTTPVTVTATTTNPYTFSVSPSVDTYYTLTALSDANCTAIAINRTGTASVTSKTWNGTSGTAWNTASNWTPSGVPTATDCVVIPNVTNDPIISGGSYNAFAYNLTILNGGVLLLNSTNSITVTDIVTVNAGGLFSIKDSASLFQINSTANIGAINMERITQPMYLFDYTYWGSPLTLASNFTLGNLSPNTLSDKYFSWIPSVANNFGTWSYETIATVMDPRKGYIVRAPQSFSASPAIKITYTANFIGTPNNGTITCPISYGTLGVASNNDKFNLLANPYPSAISAASFLNLASNANIIDGTIYFWTHNSAPSAAYPDPFYNNFVINYSASDYASWNKLGATGTAASSGGSTPNGYIAAGQGFFCRSLAVAGSATFNNSMRATAFNNQFFRNTSPATATLVEDDFEKHRLWLNLINDSSAFNQILVGYAEGATNGWDRGLDGFIFNANSNCFYSLLPNQNLVIQGRALPFDVSDEVPLGFKSTTQDNFSLRIDHFDGLFENQNIYLQDKLLNIIHDLKLSPYLFTSGIGTFNDRFVLRYTNTSLAVSNFNQNFGLVAFINNKHLIVEATQNIQTIELFDITSKLIKTYQPNRKSQKFTDNFTFPNGVYFAKIKLESGAVFTKKLMN